MKTSDPLGAKDFCGGEMARCPSEDGNTISPDISGEQIPMEKSQIEGDVGELDENLCPSSPTSPLLAPKMREQFVRTKFCPHFARGHCMHGKDCTYAHAKEELRPLPDLQKTKLCESVTRGFPCRNYNCTYAHSREELRATGDLVAYKTSLCFFHKKERCLNGEKCRFAHGNDEIRGKPLDSDSVADCNSSHKLNSPRDMQDVALQAISADDAHRGSGRIASATATIGGTGTSFSDRPSTRMQSHQGHGHHSVRNGHASRRDMGPSFPLGDAAFERPFQTGNAHHATTSHVRHQNSTAHRRGAHQFGGGSSHTPAPPHFCRRSGRESNRGSHRGATSSGASTPLRQHPSTTGVEKEDAPFRWLKSANSAPHGDESWDKDVLDPAPEPMGYAAEWDDEGEKARGQVPSWDPTEYDKGNATDAETTCVSGTPTSSSCFDPSPREHLDTPESPIVQTGQLSNHSGDDPHERPQAVGGGHRDWQNHSQSEERGIPPLRSVEARANGSPPYCQCPECAYGVPPVASQGEEQRPSGRRFKLNNMQSKSNREDVPVAYRNFRRPDGGHSSFYRSSRHSPHPNAPAVPNTWSPDAGSISRGQFHRYTSYFDAGGDGKLDGGQGPENKTHPLQRNPGFVPPTDGGIASQRASTFPGLDGGDYPRPSPSTSDSHMGEHPANGRPRGCPPAHPDVPPPFGFFPQAQRTLPNYVVSASERRCQPPRVPHRHQVYSPAVQPNREIRFSKQGRRQRHPDPVAAPNFPRWSGCSGDVAPRCMEVIIAPESHLVPRMRPLSLNEELESWQPDHYED